MREIEAKFKFTYLETDDHFMASLKAKLSDFQKMNGIKFDVQFVQLKAESLLTSDDKQILFKDNSTQCSNCNDVIRL